MNKIQDAINFIKALKENTSKTLFTEKERECYDEAISALEKLIPQRPIETPDCRSCPSLNCDSSCASFDVGYHSYRCSKCNGNSVFDYEYGVPFKYCTECGQALDWSDYNR